MTELLDQGAAAIAARRADGQDEGARRGRDGHRPRRGAEQAAHRHRRLRSGRSPRLCRCRRCEAQAGLRRRHPRRALYGQGHDLGSGPHRHQRFAPLQGLQAAARRRCRRAPEGRRRHLPRHDQHAGDGRQGPHREQGLRPLAPSDESRADAGRLFRRCGGGPRRRLHARSRSAPTAAAPGRRPASHCGVVGLKTSAGAVPSPVRISAAPTARSAA